MSLPHRTQSHVLSSTLVTACRHARRAQVYRCDRNSDMYVCAQCAIFHRSTFRRSIGIAVVVGSLLTLINQGDVLVRGDVTALIMLKMCLTYVVPFCVATFSALGANRVSSTSGRDD